MSTLELYVKYQDTVSAARKAALDVVAKKRAEFESEEMAKSATEEFKKEKSVTDETLLHLYKNSYLSALREG